MFVLHHSFPFVNIIPRFRGSVIGEKIEKLYFRLLHSYDPSFQENFLQLRCHKVLQKCTCANSLSFSLCTFYDYNSKGVQFLTKTKDF